MDNKTRDLVLFELLYVGLFAFIFILGLFVVGGTSGYIGYVVLLGDVAHMLITIFLIAIVYYAYGREYPGTVPDQLHRVPNVNRSVIEVALFFDETIGVVTLSKICTILSGLVVEGMLKKYVTVDKKTQRVHIHTKNVPKGTEDIAYSLLSIIDGKKIGDALSPREEKRAMYCLAKYLPKSITRYYNNTGEMILGVYFLISFLLGIPLLLLFGWFVPFFAGLIVFIFESFGGFMLVLIAKMHTFGRYKRSVRNEFLKWLGFKRLLKDESLIRKYKPAHISMWGKWLAYAYAYGVSKPLFRCANYAESGVSYQDSFNMAVDVITLQTKLSNKSK